MLTSTSRSAGACHRWVSAQTLYELVIVCDTYNQIYHTLCQVPFKHRQWCLTLWHQHGASATRVRHACVDLGVAGPWVEQLCLLMQSTAHR
jgi:hypothetical protein